MGLPDLRAAGGVDDGAFTSLTEAALAGVAGDMGALNALEAADALNSKASKSALKALVAAVKEAAKAGMSATQVRDDCIAQGDENTPHPAHALVVGSVLRLNHFCHSRPGRRESGDTCEWISGES